MEDHVALAAEQTTLAVQLGRVQQKLDDQNEKLDAIHRSLKDDIAVVDEKATETNGRVKAGELRHAKLEGIAIAFGVASPFVITLIAYALNKLLG